MVESHEGDGEEDADQPPAQHPRDDSTPMAYMTSDDPSPYLFESQMAMLGRVSQRARSDARSATGRRRTVAVVGVALICLVLVSLLVGVLLPVVSMLWS